MRCFGARKNLSRSLSYDENFFHKKQAGCHFLFFKERGVIARCPYILFFNS